MSWNSKLNKNVNIENYKYINDKQLFYDCLLRNIPKEHKKYII